MILGWFEVDRVWSASGARGFFDDPDEYWYHRYWKTVGLDFDGATFIAKTTTLDARMGNMVLDRRYRPRDLNPDCIKIDFIRGTVLNSVGLSGPGATALLNTGKWQERARGNFLLSFMAQGEDLTMKVRDAGRFAGMLQDSLKSQPWAAHIGLQVNFSCPNVGHFREPREVRDTLAEFSSLVQYDPKRGSFRPVPLVPKFTALEDVDAVAEAAEQPGVGAVSISQSIPFGRASDIIDWERLYPDGSPLEDLGYGKGGFSGPDVLPLTVSWLRRARSSIYKPIMAGNGIISVRDAQVVLAAGADGIEIGTVGMTRPWRVRPIVEWVKGHSTYSCCGDKSLDGKCCS